VPTVVDTRAKRVAAQRPSAPVDLRAPDATSWDQLAVPPGTDRLAGIAHTVASTLDPLIDRVVACIAREIAPYEHGNVPREDLQTSVRRNLDAILIGLAEGRGPTEAEIAVRRELGTRRATQGLPVDALIQAYHVGYRELWLALVDAVEPGDDRGAQELLTAATTVWEWVHRVTDALAAAHGAMMRSMQAREVGSRQRFVELLAAGDLDSDEAARLGQALGFSADEAYLVVVIQGASDDLDAVELQHALEPSAGFHAVVARGPLVIVVTQHAGVDDVVATCRATFPAATIGVGTPRVGLRGARASLEDAERTLAVTAESATGHFDEQWLWATLAGVGDRLEPLLAPGARIALDHQHLAQAVDAFAAAGFSVSEASRSLEVHANTVAYRLDRWEELTGWDPRTFAGLVRSIAALRSLPPTRRTPDHPRPAP
jgi:hypothetical protein